MKNILTLILIGFVLTLFNACSKSEDNTTIEDINTDSSIGCRDTNCANYTSEAAAQAAFDADPECRNDLDRDNDGIACEEPGNSVKNCASTSNCGCSNKRKAECENDPCCRWVVGEGCKCS
ncbi:excalibur calcium-binding domain-containing protein [Aquimarina mytili]|uniref:Excalibur calcium-binding domain-containing protein n=1 Tax=Aquimarina mytili TaxID=874423 RepID=A0A936ZV87_9FLAO|nr:excalibur calcium-binding domain-containing protein [Aquimarina mytili]MBL0682821.1 excalibur calcium-binding domain-containing protein [Aquimarina mytili]